MPIYDFRCSEGHVTELRASLGQDATICPECGTEARRVTVNQEQFIFGETCAKDMRRSPVPRDERRHQKAFSLYQEATQEIDHQARQVEEATGKAVRTPNYFREGVRRANRIRAGLEAPVRAEG